MPLHLVKLCVGCDSVAELEAWIAQRAKPRSKGGARGEHVHVTRMTPKRADELLDGGSLYLVIRGLISCRQRLLALRPVIDADGVRRCGLVLNRTVTPVEPRACRPFQGWRYLAPHDAPRDLNRADPGAIDMPEALRRKLSELGLM